MVLVQNACPQTGHNAHTWASKKKIKKIKNEGRRRKKDIGILKKCGDHKVQRYMGAGKALLNPHNSILQIEP